MKHFAHDSRERCSLGRRRKKLAPRTQRAFQLSVELAVAGSTLERPIKQVLRARWPAFDYDGQLMLAVGAAALGGLAMLLLFLLALDRP